MTRNVGSTDKILRILLGIVLALAGLLAPVGGGLQAAAFVVAAIALFTGVFGF